MDSNISEIKKYILNIFPKLPITDVMVENNYEVLNEIYTKNLIDGVEFRVSGNNLKIIAVYPLIEADEQYTQKPQVEKEWKKWKFNTVYIRDHDYEETIKFIEYLKTYLADNKKSLEECIYVYGPITSGKTRRAIAFGNQLIINRNNEFSEVKHVHVEYIHFKTFLDRIQSCKNYGDIINKDTIELLDNVITMSDLLIVDDFNFISNKEACLYEICSYIERRLQLSKMTMFVANYPLQEIRDKFIKGDYKNMDFYKRFFDRIKQKVQENTFFIDKLETK